jgi:DNA-binding transcriptional LysR family regulator
VATHGGFSAASRVLGVPLATVSRRVALLEQHVGVLLLNRTTRHIALTEPGERYFQACQRLVQELKDVEAEVADASAEARGDLTITAPIAFGRMHLQPVLQDFLRAHPQMRASLLLSDSVLSLAEENLDCALRIGALRDSALAARGLGSIGTVVCGAPSYLDRRGVPAALEELDKHECICWSTFGAVKSWEFGAHVGGQARSIVPARVRLTTTTAESAVDAAISGLGLVQATTYQVAAAVAAGALVPVLRAFEPHPSPVSLVYPSRRLAPPKLRRFMELAVPGLQQRLRDIAGVFRGEAPVVCRDEGA